MTSICTVLAVADIATARKFYEELFGLEVWQDYGINVSFTCGLALQQAFGWLVGLPEERIAKRPNNMEICFEEPDFDGFLKRLERFPGIDRLGTVTEQGWGQRVVRFYDPDGHIIEVGEEMKTVIERFLATGLTLEEVSVRTDVSVGDLTKLLNG